MGAGTVLYKAVSLTDSVTRSGNNVRNTSNLVLVAARKLDPIGSSVQHSGVARVIEKPPTAI